MVSNFWQPPTLGDPPSRPQSPPMADWLIEIHIRSAAAFVFRKQKIVSKTKPNTKKCFLSIEQTQITKKPYETLIKLNQTPIIYTEKKKSCHQLFWSLTINFTNLFYLLPHRIHFSHSPLFALLNLCVSLMKAKPLQPEQNFACFVCVRFTR